MVHASDIAQYLGMEVLGEDIEIRKCVSISRVEDYSCVFAKKYQESYIDALKGGKVLALVTNDYDGKLSCPHILCENPRLMFIKVLRHFFYKEGSHIIHPTAIIGSDVRLGDNVGIGAYSVLSGPIEIGSNTLIGNNVTITGPVKIGDNCRIKSGAVIGEEGFGFERDENGMCIHFPQIGEIEIGNGVYIGANSTVERAALEVTKIEDGVAIDDLTQVGHNVRLGKGSSVACGAVLCGGVRVGEACQIAPNSCVREQLSIGDHTVVGLGAVVIKNIPSNSVYIGNPAGPLERR